MGSFSIWHWLIVLIGILLPVYFVVTSKTTGPNRFGDVPPALSFGEAISSFFKNYANFEGRASRSAFWWATLFIIGVTVIADLIDPTGIISGIFSLGTLIPALSLAARRLHDTNRSGWYQVLSIFFPVGTIALIVWYATEAQDGSSVRANLGQHPTNIGSLELLERLNQLKRDGAITEAEYDEQKRKILRS